MKNIFYCSSVQSNIFPHNTRSKFYNYIDINDLSYLPDGDIEAGIKSIIFDDKRSEISLIDDMLALRCNICEPMIRNGEYDRIVSLINTSGYPNDVVHLEYKNPSFFSTKKEQLSKASFEIINLSTGEAPNFTTATATYIQIVVRKYSHRMKRPFSIFLDSSDKHSKALYPENTNMEFTIELPERMNFRRNWHLSLKSLYIPNTIFNIYEKTCFYVYYEQASENQEEKKAAEFVKEGCYPTLSALIEILQSMWDAKKLPLKIKEKNGKVQIEYDNPLLPGWTDGSNPLRQLRFGPNLAHILGFRFTVAKEGQYLRFDEKREYSAPHEPNMFLLTPRNLVVCCNIVENTILGGENVKLLRLVTNNINITSDILSFDFYQNEYAELDIKEFKDITIRITDVTGESVQSKSQIPTRLQLMFANI